MGTTDDVSATLVIASYNHAPFLPRAIASFVAQDHPDLRLIVTDDASQDDSVAVIEHELARHSLSARTVFHQRNAGICATFNEALALVETSFVAIIAADDWMEQARFSLQVPALTRAPQAAMVYSDMWVVDEDGTNAPRRFGEVYGKRWPDRRPDRSLYADLVHSNWIPAPTALSRTECLRHVGGYDESLPYEDHDMWLRLAAAGYDFAFVDEPLVNYRVTSHGMTQTFNRMPQQDQDVMDLAVLHKQLGVDRSVDAWLAPRLFHMAAHAYKAGSRDPVIGRTMRRCLRVQPNLSTAAYALLATVTQRGDRA